MHSYFGIVLWYPSYVGLINQQKLCHQTISTGEAVTYDLQSLCGCTETTFDNITISDVELTNWSLKKATFNNVHFVNVNFTKVELTSSTFLNCTFECINFKEVYLDEVRWEKLSLDHVYFDTVKICSSYLLECTVENGRSITMRNVLVGRKEIVGMEQLNDSTFALLTPSSNVSCPSHSDVGGDVNVECKSLQDSKIYRNNFIIAASAAPGNIVSAFAVYFFWRNLWMGIYFLCT